MPHSPVKTAGLKALAAGAVLGAGAVAAAPHFAAGMRKSFRPHLEAEARKNQLGPLGTMGDLGPDQFKFAHTELPMRAHVPDEVYVAAAHGHLSENEVAHLEDFSALLHKEAGAFQTGLNYGLGTAAASAVGGLAMMGVSHGVESTYDALTFEKDLQATLRTRPELNTYPKEQVRLVYRSLRRLSPEIAKDPLTAGTYLARQFERRNPSDPHSLPTVELETARSLSQVTSELSKRRDAVRDVLLEANHVGVQAGAGAMMEARKQQKAREIEAFKHTMKVRGDKDVKDHEYGLRERSEGKVQRALDSERAAYAGIGTLEQHLRDANNQLSAHAATIAGLQQQVANNSPMNRQQRIAEQARQMREARDAGRPNPFGNPGRRR